ncbi:MAG: hypothetical protein JSV78_05810 [Phycisphaerales bacterium]|nr:MAG: hypothetical protein JSV78_05810 [Phycisphaerales bacterium]
MTSQIPSLWPEDIPLETVGPQVILVQQAQHLEKWSKGLLQAEVTTETSEDQTLHHLDVLAPAVSLRRRALSARHARESPYPVAVESFCLPTSQEANTQQGFMDLLFNVLGSDGVKALLQSLIARINESQSNQPERSEES